MTGRGDRTTASGDVRIEHLTKRFGDFIAVDDLSLTIPQGSFFALLGPSGCGKTTTLRMVAGLEEPTSGIIAIGEQDITWTRPYKRPVNTVFQSYALFPHIDIFENVAFGLRRQGIRDVKQRVLEALALVELEHVAGRKPSQLSGGQQQRVALARAIVNRPAVLLLDEPLGALDLKLRRQMQLELKRIQTDVGITFVHVTHDQEEAMTMADTVAVMNAGHIEQMGPPHDLYDYPATTFAANFLGQSNLLGAELTGRTGEDLLVDVSGQRLVISAARSRSTSARLLIGIRPEKVHIGAADEQPGERMDVLRGGRVTDASFTGVSTQYLVRMPWGQELAVFAQNVGTGAQFRPGDEVVLSWDPQRAFGLDGSQDVLAGVEHEAAAVQPASVG